MATTAAVMFAVAAVAQNGAVATVVEPGSVPSLGVSEFRALARSRAWLASVSLTAVASILHAGALVLAPVSVVQPIGVLSVPIAVVIAARRTGRRPPPVAVAAVVSCLVAVGVFVLLADRALGSSPTPRFVGALSATAGTAAVAAALALVAFRSSGWLRCAAYASAGATAFGLVSALMRLVSLHLASGVNDLDDVGVWLPAIGIAAALLGGGWAIQQAHASGAPAVVVGCTTVVDPLVAVGLGVTMLGEGSGATPVEVGGLLGCAALALGSAAVLARRHPQVHPVA